MEGRSSASADFLLEAEKRGSPPKSEKRSFWEHILKKLGGGERGEGCSPFAKKNQMKLVARDSQNLGGKLCHSKPFFVILSASEESQKNIPRFYKSQNLDEKI